MKHYFKIKNNWFLFKDKPLLQSDLKKYEGKDCYFEIHRKKIDKNPTRAQRGYYFTVILQIFIECYFKENSEMLSKEEAHLMLRLQCNYREIVNDNTGEIMRIPLSTSNSAFDLIDQIDYLDHVIKFIESWYMVEVPLPDKNWKSKK